MGPLKKGGERVMKILEAQEARMLNLKTIYVLPKIERIISEKIRQSIIEKSVFGVRIPMAVLINQHTEKLRGDKENDQYKLPSTVLQLQGYLKNGLTALGYTVNLTRNHEETGVYLPVEEWTIDLEWGS